MTLESAELKSLVLEAVKAANRPLEERLAGLELKLERNNQRIDAFMQELLARLGEEAQNTDLTDQIAEFVQALKDNTRMQESIGQIQASLVTQMQEFVMMVNGSLDE